MLRMYEDDLVLIHIPLSDNDLGSPADDEFVGSIEESICRVLERDDVGMWDGHEFGQGWAKIFVYGPNADAVCDSVLPILLVRDLPHDAFLLKRNKGRSDQVIRLHAVDVA